MELRIHLPQFAASRKRIAAQVWINCCKFLPQRAHLALSFLENRIRHDTNEIDCLLFLFLKKCEARLRQGGVSKRNRIFTLEIKYLNLFLNFNFQSMQHQKPRFPQYENENVAFRKQEMENQKINQTRIALKGPFNLLHNTLAFSILWAQSNTMFWAPVKRTLTPNSRSRRNGTSAEWLLRSEYLLVGRIEA